MENKISVNVSGETAGQSPLEVFLSSLGGCIGVYARKYFDRHALTFARLKIQVEAELSQDYPTRLVNIKATVDTDAKLDDKKEAFLKFVHNCPVHNTILNTKEVDIQLAVSE